jgi:putative ABC transport system ATP-binding protein
MKDGLAMIRLEAVTKVFYTDELESHALDGVHLDVRQGEFLSISGPSGCGKSTMLALLGLLDSPTAGRYLLEGRDVTELGAAERARVRNERIGFIFQAFNLTASTTIRRSSPAASSSASRSPAPLPASPRSCWPTSRPGTSTRATARR